MLTQQSILWPCRRCSTVDSIAENKTLLRKKTLQSLYMKKVVMRLCPTHKLQFLSVRNSRHAELHIPMKTIATNANTIATAYWL